MDKTELHVKLAALCQQLPFEVTADKQAQLVEYVALLHKWNKAYNLTSVRDPNEMLVKHIVDSLAIGPYINGTRFIDVGTGPGLPGIPLAILYPEKHFTLLDTLGKRVRFMRQAIHQIGLENAVAVQSRVEQYIPSEPLDGVISRAFASLTDMLTWCHHLVDSNGRFFAMKGVYPEQELEDMPAKFMLVQSHQVDVPELQADRTIIELQKIDL